MMLAEFELEPGEEVVREVRKHWFLFVIGLLPFVILALLPYIVPGIMRLSPQLSDAAANLQTNATLMRAVTGIWLLFVWTSAWGAFTRYYLNVWVLTNQRIVEIKQRGYFNREVSSTLLNRVQDVTTDVAGVLPSLLGIGSISVQSAGAVNEFNMYGIPKPEEMRDLILRYSSAEPKETGV